jgi:hypothetical protein
MCGDVAPLASCILADCFRVQIATRIAMESFIGEQVYTYQTEVLPGIQKEFYYQLALRHYAVVVQMCALWLTALRCAYTRCVSCLRRSRVQVVEEPLRCSRPCCQVPERPQGASARKARRDGGEPHDRGDGASVLLATLARSVRALCAAS